MKRILLTVLILLLTGCATPTLKETNKLLYGMAKQQVTGYLGEPEEVIKEDNFEYLYFRLPGKWYSRTKYDYFVKLKEGNVVGFGHHAPLDKGDE